MSTPPDFKLRHYRGRDLPQDGLAPDPPRRPPGRGRQPLTRPGASAGFAAGVAAILGNPKAILFYKGVLPGFFDLARITCPDIAAILAVSVAIPMAGNLTFALTLDRVRQVLASPRALRRMNLGAGVLLLAVAGVIALT
jgi:threonine/homoserine/homoserine lactone efflux protein